MNLGGRGKEARAKFCYSNPNRLRQQASAYQNTESKRESNNRKNIFIYIIYIHIIYIKYIYSKLDLFTGAPC